MAEMTAKEAVAWLTEDKAFGQECYSRKQIAQLIKQQQQQIEQQVLFMGCGVLFHGFGNIFIGCEGGAMMCDKFNGVTYPNGFPPEKTIVEPQTPESILTKQVLQLKADLAAAKAELAAEIEEKLIPYKISLTKELAIMTERAEQAEAQIAKLKNLVRQSLCEMSKYETCFVVEHCGVKQLCKAYYAKAALEDKP